MSKSLSLALCVAFIGSCSDTGPDTAIQDGIGSVTAALTDAGDGGGDSGVFAGGSGTSADPYLISTCAQLQAMETDLDADYKLTTDIDCAGFDAGDGKGFRPIGDFDWMQRFFGSLDGDGHVVSNLSMQRPTEDQVALIGVLEGGTVSRIGLENVDIDGDEKSAGLVGFLSGGVIEESYVTGVVEGEWSVGGLVGYAFFATITDSYSAADVAGTLESGLFIGISDSTTIQRGYSSGAQAGTPALTYRGFEWAAVFAGAFFDCDVAGQCTDTFAESTATLQSQTFLTAAGYDFVSTWSDRGAGTYACLQWEATCGTSCASDDTTCDGVDDDCDATNDEDYAGSSTSCGVGVCASTGSTSCVSGAVEDSCAPGTATDDDSICDGLDGDCDGATDEAFSSAATTCGVGACEASGTISCVAGAEQDSCTPGTPSGDDSVCDGTDNDCDGATDEAFSTAPTSCGVGVCSASGATSCVAGSVEDSCTPGTPTGTDSVCDGADEDCDGSTDEAFASSTTSCGVGVCAATGATSCVAGSVEDSCSPGVPTGSDSVCDGADEDCDGATDEAFASTPTTCGIGVCASVGSTSCSSGSVQDSCVVGLPTGDDSVCNGVDDDCDGLIDEAFVSTATTCGVGGCSASGVTLCVAGAVVDTCTPGTPAPDDAVCDGVDADCDTVTDEDFAPSCNGTLAVTCIAGVEQSTQCDDGDPCNGDETCSAGACVGGPPPPVADDGNPCTEESCGGGMTTSTPIYGTAECPFDPADVAPPLPRLGQNQTFAEDVSFLHDGSSGIQTGVVPGALEAERVTRIFGEVRNDQGGAFGGVRVSILNHPELGQTFSRADGRYDLVVNGGHPLVVVFERDGFITVQRPLTSNYNEHERVDDVVLIPYDAASTIVTLGAATAQAHSAAIVTDEDGTRTARVLVPAGTTANMLMPDGSSTPLTTGTLRATEVTVGPDGPARMPGALPRHIMYTYAVELSFDEAVAANAERVVFSEPVYFYVDNFLGWDVGDVIPVGFYDRGEGSWFAEPDGVIVEVLSTTSGLADIDIDGDGVSESATVLSDFGFTDDERAYLATTYPLGSSFWRAPVAHFSLWDLNVVAMPPDDAELGPNPKVGPGNVGDSCEVAGSIIQCENRTVAEEIPIVGTGFSLRYQSDRVQGYRESRRLRFPVADDSDGPPASRKRMRVEIDVAGRSIEFVSTLLGVPEPGGDPDIRFFDFEWDGLDWAGRQVTRPVTTTLRLCHIFPALPALQRVSVLGGTGSGESFGSRALLASASASTARERSEFDFCTTVVPNRPLGVLDSLEEDGLGGLSFSGRHHLAAGDTRIYRGDGRTEQRLSTIRATTLAGTIDDQIAGTCPDPSGVGTPLDGARLGITATTLDPDGSLILANIFSGSGQSISCPFTSFEGSYGIFRVEADQTLTRIVGHGGQRSWDAAFEGMDALSVPLNVVSDIAYGPDGSLYLANEFEGLILRVAPDGVIRTFAGNTTCLGSITAGISATDEEAGEDLLATDVCAFATDLEVDANGIVYFTDRLFGRVRYISPEGRMRTVAGGGGPSASFISGDCAPGCIPADADARSLVLTNSGRFSLALDDDENVVFSLDGLIIRVGSDEKVELVTGSAPLASIDSGDLAGSFSGRRFIRAIDIDTMGRIVFLEEPDNFTGEHNVWVIDDAGYLRRIAGEGPGGPRVTDVPPDQMSIRSDLGDHGDILAYPNGDLLILEARFETVSGFEWNQYLQLLDGDDLLVDFGAVASSLTGERYEFDAGRRHVRTVDPNYGTTLYEMTYDPMSGLLNSVVDNFGNEVSVTYSANEIRFIAPYGEETIVELDINGRATVIRYANDPNPAAQILLDYDPVATGLLEFITDRRGNVHDLTFDEFGRLEQDTHSLGASWDVVATGVEVLPDDLARRSVTLTDSLGRDRMHTVTAFADGRLERQVENPDGTVNRVVMHIDDGRASHIERFEANGILVDEQLTADPLYGWQQPFVSSATFTLPSGATTRSDMTVEVVRPAPASLDVSSWTFATTTNADVVGAEHTSTLVTTRNVGGTWSTVATSHLGRRTRVVTDAEGRVVESGVLNSDDTYVFEPVRYSYEAGGRLEFARQGSGANERALRFHYNSADLPNSNPERGYPLGIETPEGDLSTFAWDELGQLSSETRYVAAGNETTELGYDEVGLVDRVRPPERNDHLMSYSGYDALQFYSPPTLSGVATDTTWTPGGERQEIDRVNLPDGRSIDYTYDAPTGRLTSLTLASVGAVLMSYSPLGGEAVGDTGQLRSVTMPQVSGANVTNELVYDGPLLTEMRTVGLPGGTHVVAFSYDPDDELRLNSIQVGSETPTNYTYDDDGLLTGAGPLTVTRNAVTGLADTATVGVVRSTFTPNDFGEQASIDTDWGSDQLNFAFQYDLNGRIVSRTETSLSAAEQQVYVHDEAGRLTDVFLNDASTPTYHYEYDANGNRLAWQTPTSTCLTGCVDVDEQDRLLRHGSTTFTYNDFGQLTSKTEAAEVTQYSYDELGNLRQVDLPDGRVITYLIDGQNRRVGRLVDGVATQYWIYKDAINPIAQMDAAGAIEQVYIYGTNDSVPDLILEADGDVLTVITDQVGSVRRIVDATTGTVVASYSYSPFGVVETQSVASGFDQPFGFAGGLWDSESGLVRFGARDYDPERGRWTARDPILFDGGDTNLFAYVGSRPVDETDPGGLFFNSCSGVCAAIAAMGATVINRLSPAAVNASNHAARTFNRVAASCPNIAANVRAAAQAPVLRNSHPTLTFAKTAPRKIARHMRDIREAARSVQFPIPKGRWARPEVQNATYDFIEAVVRFGSEGLGHYKSFGQVAWYRVGDGVVLATKSGRFITFFAAQRGGAMANAPGAIVW